ncbi:MAG: DUF1566 domain-containing protein [Flavobacteriales bacterium]|nr:DUF1566 domain-containing protein [Flavobacteriales bacterium]
MKKILMIIIAASLVAVGCKKKEGCTDSTATNYDFTAEKDNGSCTYASTGTTTTGTTTTGTTTTGTSTSMNASVGDFRDGGIVFWVDKTDSTKGLVVSLNDMVNAENPQYSSARWGCSGTDILGADSAAIGTGAQNTIDILAGCSEVGSAADLCAKYTGGGFNDWFLPSKDELYEIRNNMLSLEPALIANGGSNFKTANGTGNFRKVFWSSTDDDALGAWLQSFHSGLQLYALKTAGPHPVRAVRAF